MSYRFPALAALLCALSACGSASGPGNDATAAGTDGKYVERMAGLNEKERNAVLFRAIRDAGRDCQRVERSVLTDPVQGKPSWVATCDNDSAWLVTLSKDGIATVTDAHALAGRIAP